MAKTVRIYKDVENCEQCPFYDSGHGWGDPYCEKDKRRTERDITSENQVPNECPFIIKEAINK